MQLISEQIFCCVNPFFKLEPSLAQLSPNLFLILCHPTFYRNANLKKYCTNTLRSIGNQIVFLFEISQDHKVGRPGHSFASRQPNRKTRQKLSWLISHCFVAKSISFIFTYDEFWFIFQVIWFMSLIISGIVGYIARAAFFPWLPAICEIQT